MSEPIRILIVDDHPLVREGLRQVLARPEFEVVGEAGNATDAVTAVGSASPHVVVLDINLPGENGIAVAAQLRSRYPEVRILMLSVHDHHEYVLESARAGAHGYLRKDSLPEALRESIRTVRSGRTAFSVTHPSGDAVAPIMTAAGQRLELLTRRERDVLIGVASGQLNKEIAASLGLSVRTVESYRESLMRKLGIPNAAGLTRFAIEANVLGQQGP
jgi:two-component system nitrate/nitrite response regulator NarL